MKLLIFSPYYPPHTGGLESHADEFNKFMSPHVSKIKVFTPRLPFDAIEKETLYGNVEIVRFPAFEIIQNYPVPKFWSATFWKLFSSLFRENYDVVISRTRFFLTSLLALIYAKIKKVKWIHIEHGSDFVQLSSSFKTLIAKLYDWTFGFLIFRTSDQNISISKAVQKFVQKFDKRESPVIYRGLDMAEIDAILPNSTLKETYDGKTIISFVGRLYKWKGVENSILAIKSLPPEIKNQLVFLIIGNGEDFQTLKKLSKNESCIQMLGNLPRKETIGILKISDIYLHSAYSGGGLSTALLEAMYCGCTIIATPNEGADEVVNDNENGFLIKKSDQKLISEKIQKILEKNILSQKKVAKITIRKNFDWKNTTRQYKMILTSTNKKIRG